MKAIILTTVFLVHSWSFSPKSAQKRTIKTNEGLKRRRRAGNFFEDDPELQELFTFLLCIHHSPKLFWEKVGWE